MSLTANGPDGSSKNDDGEFLTPWRPDQPEYGGDDKKWRGMPDDLLAALTAEGEEELEKEKTKPPSLEAIKAATTYAGQTNSVLWGEVEKKMKPEEE